MAADAARGQEVALVAVVVKADGIPPDVVVGTEAARVPDLD